MQRKTVQIIRIAAILTVSELVIGTSVARVFEDDFMKLKQEQFQPDRQLRQEQFKIQQQFQQEQQAAAKAAMQAEQMKQQLEDAGKLKKGAQDIQGKIMLENLDHEHDMELEVLKDSLGAE